MSSISSTLRCSALALAALISQPVSAWWCYGHVLVAEIARLSVTDDVNAKVDDYIKFLRETADFPKCGPNYVACACWADDLKGDGLRAMAQWHYINIPVFEPKSYVPPGGRPTEYLSASDGNVANKIESLEKTASEGAHYSDSKLNKWEMSFAIANLIHFIGDVHQPLHAATLYSSNFPTGDEGGNKFAISCSDSKITELHAIWDSMCLTHTADPTRPFDSSTTSQVTSDAQALIAQYKSTFSEHQTKVYQGMIMANESWKLAETSAYRSSTPQNELQPGASLTPDNYLNACTTVAQSQVTLAGLRLASEFTYLFGPRKAGEKKYLSEEHDADTIVSRFRARYGFRSMSPLAEKFLRNQTHFKHQLQFD